MSDKNDNMESVDESSEHHFVAGMTGVGKSTKHLVVMSEIAEESGYDTDTVTEMGCGRSSGESRRDFERRLAESDDETGPVWFDPKGGNGTGGGQ